ncbi:putative nuclease HARBI1 isoform X1, partial [Ixodes scapularis]
LYREHRDAFELPEEIFRKQYRLPKIVVRWLCDELLEEPEVRRVRTSWTVMTVELQVLCALRFYGTGSFQGMVASDEHVARDQKTVGVAVRAVSVAIVRRLGVQRGWIHFPETPSERFDAEKGFRLLGRIPGVIGCVDGTIVSIVSPSKNDPTVTKAAYWCSKYFYAVNVMVVCDADCRIMCIDPRYPGSVHDSFVWQFSWLRNQLEQGQLPRDGRFLLGDSGYPLEPWLITPVPGNHATSTACGRFNKAHSSIRSVVERCIGLFKNRFRCLQRHRALYYHPSTATVIISACTVLHNICLALSEPEPESDSDPEESELESEPSSDGSEPSSERSASAPERLAPAGPPVGLPVGLSDRGK